MPKVTALKMDVVTKKSGHQMTGLAVSVCITPAAPSPLPIPYPTMGTVAEGILDPAMRTKVSGAIVMTVGSCMSKCHGNEPGTLKEVVSLNTAGPCFPVIAAPLVICELGMMGITMAFGFMNKSITVGASGSASGAGGNASGGGGGGGGGGGPNGPGTQGPSGGGGDGGGSSDAASPPEPPAPPEAEGQQSGGHPVDVMTGTMFTVPSVDLELGGPLPMQWVRSYRTSAVERRCGIGWGWSHNFAWRAVDDGLRVTVIDSYGTAIPFPDIDEEEVAVAPFGRRLERVEGALHVKVGDDAETLVLRPYRRRRYRLEEVVDAAGNRIRVRWDDERVVAVTDSVGRELHVERDGKVDIWRLTLTSLEGEKHTSFVASYEYDDRGDLVRVIDAGGAVTSYRYDDQHYLVEERLPDGLSYHFVYEKGADGKRRCVETWGAIDGLDVLADLSGGYLTTSPERKGVHHTRFVYEPERRRTTMIDAMGHSHRFVGNDLGLVTEYVDPLGGVTRRAFTPTGGMVMEVDPTGRRERRSIDAAGRWLRYGNAKGSVAFKRDAAGHASEVLESDGSRWQMERNAQGKIVKRTHPDGSAVTCAYDERGLALEVSGPGGKETYEYDAHGNLVRRTNVCGATWRYSWDLRGYPVEAVTPSGGSYRFEYDSWGNVADVKTSDGRRSQRELDALGKAVAVQYPGGGVGHTRWVAGSIVERSYADDHGAWRFGYDAMLRLIWLENPDGERQAFSYDGAGRLASHRQLTGHEWHYDRDAAGNVVARTGAEGTAHYELDEVGKIVAQSHVDGSRTVVLRDHFGRPVEGRHGITEVTLEREPSRFVRREVQQAGAWRFVVERSYDELGYEIATRYSTGWGVERERGQGGNVHAIRVVDGDGGVEEGFELGWEGERVIRRQGSASAIRTLRDEWRRAVAVQVVGKDGEVLRERHYRWSVLGAVEEVVDSRRGSRRYTLDNMSRPTAVDGLGSRETFRYTCHGTPVATSRDEKVGSFGRKTQVAGTTYAWDGQGRLFRQIGASPHESWEYSYDGQSQLVAATRGDGYWVKHIYDAFGRRLATNRSDGTSTFYGWDRDTIVEETHSDGRRERRVYGIDGMTAYASARDEGPWRLIASDQAGTPWLYLDPEDGIEELDLTAWGRVAHREGKPGSLRFAGQIQDDDTGLYYNRYRYYSPELGTYLTPDPLGLQASARHDIGFVPNTTAWVDLLGLIIISAAPNDPEGEVQEAVKHRAGATNEDVLNVSSGGGLVPANGGAASDKPLAGHKRVEIISHGPPSGSCILWGDERIDGTELGKRLQEAGLEPDAEVVIVACFAGADSSSSGKKRTVAAKLNKATGNPVFGPSGITNVLPWPNTSEEINGHLNMNGGHWTSATGPTGGPQTLTSNAPPTQKTDTF